MKKSLKQELVEALESEHQSVLSEYETGNNPHDYENCEICKLIAKATKKAKK